MPTVHHNHPGGQGIASALIVKENGSAFRELRGALHYAASNWLELGLTQGRSRGDRDHRLQVPIKAVYVYALSGQARQRLCR